MKHSVQLRLNYIKTKCALEHNLHSQICFHRQRGGTETVITFSFFYLNGENERKSESILTFKNMKTKICLSGLYYLSCSKRFHIYLRNQEYGFETQIDIQPTDEYVLQNL